jgi:uncharacterized protein YdiU (UPF0061 family)
MVSSNSNQFHFDNTYSMLPERFFARIGPTPVQKPGLIKINRLLANNIGLDPNFLETPTGIKILSGNQTPVGAEPIAMAYAGHQFGGWVPQLGDGRAVLLGEIIGTDGCRYDLHLKGAGQTPFSRNGDGRAWVGPILREYIISEAMAALGIPTTRALAAVTTGETVMREGPFPGALLARVASSHIRVGTFQYFSARKDIEALRLLSDHIIKRHYPEAESSSNSYLSLLENVIEKQSKLIAKWMSVGFIHGVMNTDNMSIAGDTIDYGPCAFMDDYHPDKVFSSIDQMGRYAYGNQPVIAQWNLSCFASAILPLIDKNEEAAIEAATERLNYFPEKYEKAWSSIFCTKVGLLDKTESDTDLAKDLLDCMSENNADFTSTFRQLSRVPKDKDPSKKLLDKQFTSLFKNQLAAEGWLMKWRQRLCQNTSSDRERQKSMHAINPAYIPRNHRIEEIILASLEGNFSPFEKLNDILSNPFEEQIESIEFQKPPLPEEMVHETFCGT